MSGMVCKGAWQLGTECGTCERCLSAAPDYIAELRAKLKPPPPPDGKRSLAEVSADIRNLTRDLNNVLSEGVAAHELRIEIDIDHLETLTRDPIPRLRVEQYKRVD